MNQARVALQATPVPVEPVVVMRARSCNHDVFRRLLRIWKEPSVLPVHAAFALQSCNPVLHSSSSSHDIPVPSNPFLHSNPIQTLCFHTMHSVASSRIK
eukprot:857225-Rhodomonas_salina.16